MFVFVFLVLAFSSLDASTPLEENDDPSFWNYGRTYVRCHLLSDVAMASAVILFPRYPRTTKAFSTIIILGALYCFTRPYDPVAGAVLNSFFNSRSSQKTPMILTLLALGYHLSNCFR